MVLDESQTFDSLIESERKVVADTESQIEAAKAEIESKHQKQADIDAKIKNQNDVKTGFNGEISIVKQKISSNKAQIKILKENIKKNEGIRLKLKF